MSKKPFKRNLERIIPVDISYNKDSYDSYIENCNEDIFNNFDLNDNYNDNSKEDLFLDENQIKNRKNQTANNISKK